MVVLKTGHGHGRDSFMVVLKNRTGTQERQLHGGSEKQDIESHFTQAVDCSKPSIYSDHLPKTIHIRVVTQKERCWVLGA